MITVACVLKSGGRYSPDDVAKLSHNVAQKLSLPNNFVCISDISVP